MIARHQDAFQFFWWTDPNNAQVCMVSTSPLNSKFSSLFIWPLGINKSVLITIGITVNFAFHIFLVLLQGLRFISLFAFFYFLLLVHRQTLIFLLTISRLDVPTGIGWCVHISKSQGTFMCLILLDGFRVGHIPLVCLVNFQFVKKVPRGSPTLSVVASHLVFFSLISSIPM